MPGTEVPIANAAIGVSIPRMARAPDLSDTAAFVRTLLSARNIALVDPKSGGTSGIYLDGLFQRLGIAEAVRKKAVWATMGSEVAADVASGKAELGLTFISEMLPNKDVRIAGPLPDSIQRVTEYVVAIPASSAHPDAAKAFISALRAPPARPLIRKAGLVPIEN